MDVDIYAAVGLVKATTPMPPQHALTGLGAANCHTPGKFWSCLTCHIVYNTVQNTRRKVSDHHNAGKHTRVPQDLQPAQLT